MRPLRFQLFFATAAPLKPGVLLRIPIKFSQVSIYLAHDFIDNILFDPVFPGQGKRSGITSPERTDPRSAVKRSLGASLTILPRLYKLVSSRKRGRRYLLEVRLIVGRL